MVGRPADRLSSGLRRRGRGRGSTCGMARRSHGDAALDDFPQPIRVHAQVTRILHCKSRRLNELREIECRLGILAKQFMSSGCPCIAPIRPTDHHKVHSCTCERQVRGATVNVRISARPIALSAANECVGAQSNWARRQIIWAVPITHASAVVAVRYSGTLRSAREVRDCADLTSVAASSWND